MSVESLKQQALAAHPGWSVVDFATVTPMNQEDFTTQIPTSCALSKYVAGRSAPGGSDAIGQLEVVPVSGWGVLILEFSATGGEKILWLDTNNNQVWDLNDCTNVLSTGTDINSLISITKTEVAGIPLWLIAGGVLAYIYRDKLKTMLFGGEKAPAPRRRRRRRKATAKRRRRR